MILRLDHCDWSTEISRSVFGGFINIRSWIYPFGKRDYNIMADNVMMPGGNETILIVDDHETIWDFLIEALQKLGYSVLLAENGLDAVEIYESNPDEIDLVLLDMIMPKAGGHQTFFKIRAIDPEAKILLSSGYVSEEEVRDILAQGACGFLAKPHRLPVVAKAIRDALDGKVCCTAGLTV